MAFARLRVKVLQKVVGNILHSSESIFMLNLYCQVVLKENETVFWMILKGKKAQTFMIPIIQYYHTLSNKLLLT